MAALQLITLQSGLAGRYPAQRSPLLLPPGEKQQSLLQLGRTVKSSRHGQAKVFAGLQSVDLASVELASRPSKVAQKDWKELSNQLSQSSPFTIIQQALQIFGSDVGIAFSGAEDVALIEYAHLTGLPFRVFSLETGRLHEETLKLFQDVEKRYNIHIEYMFPDAAEVEAMVRAKGLFSFYEDGHQECCGVRKVRPLKRALKGLRAWITGQRKDQSPGTRANVPVVQVDSTFEGLDGGPGSLVKWNPLANVTSSEVWNFLRTMEVPVNALHAQGFISIGCQPCTRSVLPGQHEREGRWWWEDATAKECGLHKGNISGLDTADAVASDSRSGHDFPDLFTSKNVKALSREEIEGNITHPRDKAGFVVLYAPWCPFSQAMDEAFNEVAERLKDSAIMVGKFRADGDQKAFAQEKLELKSFPTILFLPKGTDTVVKYLSERRDVDSLLAFVKAFQ